MKTTYKYKYLVLCIGLLFTVTACNEFLDINTDPNNPTEAPLPLLMTSAQVDIAGALGSSIGGLSAIPQAYMHQMFQRGTTEGDYGVNGADFEIITPWTILYTLGLNDLEQIIIQGETLEAWSHVGVAQIIKAYAFSLMVDMYGDVPYTEAFQHTENIAPAYEDDEAVYDKLLLLLDDAIENLATAPSVALGGEDLIYAGDLDKWRKFAKSVKLKMYTQMRLVRNVSTEVNALLTEGDLISAADGSDDFQFVYNNVAAPDNRNPAFTQEWTTGASQYYINPYFYETLAGLNTFGHRGYGEDLALVDPRIPYYFYNQLAPGDNAENPCAYCDLDVNGNNIVPELTNTGFLSIYMFSFNIDPSEGFDQSSSQTVAGLYPVGGAYDTGAGGTVAATQGLQGASTQRFLGLDAIHYLAAELYLSGDATGDDVAALSAAIQASFDKVNSIAATAGADPIPQADIDTYITTVMNDYAIQTDAGKMEHIMTQKWIASFGFACDAYTDYRRTGYPEIHDGNTDNLAVTVQVRDFPYAFPWVNSNLEINPSAPSQKEIATSAARIFWDPS
ncbi:MAG: SusD/RagB family nutrient-binding outer membrane lipoprotein [Cytophagales bacterium]|nr:SusD/RagB family nutrient-binding outer membrane lipoprotein [Cytophagales bacterium]